MNRVAVVAAVVVLVISSVGFAYGDVTLGSTSGFEDGTFQGWDQFSANSGSVAVNTNNPIRGSWSVEYSETSGTAGGRGGILTHNQFTTFDVGVLFHDATTGVEEHHVGIYFWGNATDGWLIYYGNVGGTDDPRLELRAPNGTAVTSKAVEYPQSTDIRANATIYAGNNTLVFESFYASNGTALHSLTHTFDDIQHGEVGIIPGTGAGQTGQIYLDNAYFDGETFDPSDGLTANGAPMADASEQFNGEQTGEAVTNHDFMNDSANRTTLVEATDQVFDGPHEDFTSAGAGSIYRASDGTTYIALRQRTDNNRGAYIEVYSTTGSPTDAAGYSLVFNETMTDDVTSVEAMDLRRFDGTWYLYFTYDEGNSDNWDVAFVTASTVAGLQTELDAGLANYNEILSDAGKDPRVFEFQGRFYLIAKDQLTATGAHTIYRSQTPNFSSTTNVSKPTDVWLIQPEATNTGNPSNIFFDEHTDRFVYAAPGNISGTPEQRVIWYATSTNLTTWTFAGYEKTGPDDDSLLRYLNYWSDDTGLYVVGDLDRNADNIENFTIWHYAQGSGTTTTLVLDTNPWMDHGSRQPYRVLDGSDDVTGAASVNSSNSSVVSVDSTSHELVATSDEAVAERVTIEATYQGRTATQNVTVANRTLDNFVILPPTTWLFAIFGFPGDTTGATDSWPGAVQIQWIFVAMTVGAVVNWRSRNDFLGLATVELMLLFGWTIDWVSNGLLVASIVFVIYAALVKTDTIDATGV